MNDNTKQTNSYATKLDQLLAANVSSWFESLSKEELIEFISDRSDITADTIRSMFAGSQTVFGFGVNYSTVSNDAAATFDDTQP